MLVNNAKIHYRTLHIYHVNIKKQKMSYINIKNNIKHHKKGNKNRRCMKRKRSQKIKRNKIKN